MALHLSSSPSSFTLATSSYSSGEIDRHNLRPGDYLTVDDGVVGDFKNGHVVLFEGWYPAYPRFTYYGFGGTDGQRNSLRHRIGDFSGAATPNLSGDDGGNGSGVLDGHATSKYKAHRYRNIVDDAPVSTTAVTRTPSGAIELFARTATNQPVEYWQNPGSPWLTSVKPWGSISGVPVAFINGRSGSIEVFARSGTGNLVHFWYDTTGWHTETVGGPIATDPAAFYDPISGAIEVFAAQGGSLALVEYWKFPGGSWLSSVKGGVLYSKPLAFPLPHGGIEVLVRGSDDQLYENRYAAASGWSGFRGLGGRIVTAPSGFYDPATNAIEVFARSISGNLVEYWQNGLTSSWNNSVKPWLIKGTPVAFGTAGGGIEVFARGTDNTLAEFWYSPARGWQGASQGGSLGGSPIGYLYEPGTGRIDIFAPGANLHIYCSLPTLQDGP